MHSFNIKLNSEVIAPGLACLIFIGVYCLTVNLTHLSASHERQCQTSEVARQIYERGLLSAWQPRANFADYDRQDNLKVLDTTVIRYEVPFHGIIGWPFFKTFGWHGWLTGALSVAFALLSILFSWKFFRLFADIPASCFGLVLLTLSPLFLHYGQVPMPDVISFAGMTGSLYFAGLSAQRNRADEATITVSVCFSALFLSFGILAKPSLLPFGLPVLLLAMSAVPERSDKAKVIALFFLISGLPFVLWNLLGLWDPPHSWNLLQASTAPGHKGFPDDLFWPEFYLRIFSYIVFFGIGLPGIICLAPGVRKVVSDKRFRVWIFGAFISIMFTYLSMVRYMWREPQYSLVVLFWLVFLSVIGFGELRREGNTLLNRKIFAMVVALHLVMVAWMTAELKAGRVPNSGSLERVGEMLPAGAKIVQISPSYGGTPTFFLHRKTVAFHPSEGPAAAVRHYKECGYDYLLFWDYTLRGSPLERTKTISARERQPDVLKYAEDHLERIYDSNGVLVFRIT